MSYWDVSYLLTVDVDAVFSVIIWVDVGQVALHQTLGHIGKRQLLADWLLLFLAEAY